MAVPHETIDLGSAGVVRVFTFANGLRTVQFLTPVEGSHFFSIDLTTEQLDKLVAALKGPQS